MLGFMFYGVAVILLNFSVCGCGFIVYLFIFLFLHIYSIAAILGFCMEGRGGAAV